MDSPARPSQAKMVSSTGGTEGSSPASSPASASSLAVMAAPKFGTLVPNRIFVGGISASTSEAELAQLFSAYGNVKATKIIADRGGVSKGYGFVTFETEEEAKRLQQESECIVLRERKLNIAPAIKKQSFSRSFDGGTGSPPAVPTSTYYYTNGIGLPFASGVTYYNTGAPGPNTALTTTTDPATLYQAAGVFGPQATTSHQTFAPVMYPVPAPSLYMPQQYPYSPIPYEPYFPATTAAGGPQFLYATNGAQGTTSGSGNGSGASSSGTVAVTGAGATSPPSTAASLGPSPPQFQTHFYGHATAAASHHHPSSIAGGPHALPPPPPHAQMEHLYYSYPSSPHAVQSQPHQAGPLTLASEQQLHIYSMELSGPTSVNESQFNHQEDTRSTSNHSEQLQHSGTTTSDSGGGGSGGGGGTHPAGQTTDPSTQSMLPLMPLKYSLSHRYANFHPIAVHSSLQQQQQPQQQSQQSHSQQQQHQQQLQQQQLNQSQSNDGSVAAEEHRAVSLYPAPLYLPQGTQYHPVGSGNSLLSTPGQQPYDHGASNCKLRDYAKTGLATGTALLHRPTGPCFKQYGLQGAQVTAHVPPGSQHKYPRVATSPARIQHQHYGRRPAQPQPQLASAAYYFQQKPCQYGAAPPRAGQRILYGAQPAQITAYAFHPLQKGFTLATGYEYTEVGRRGLEGGTRQSGGRKSAILNSYRGSNLTIGGPNVRPPRVPESVEAVASSGTTSSVVAVTSGASPTVTTAATMTGTTPTGTMTTIATAVLATTTMTTTIGVLTATTCSNSCNSSAASEPEAKCTLANSGSESPQSPVSYDSVSRPIPSLSPSPNPKQVQFFGSSSGGSSGSGQRFGNSSASSISHHQQQRSGTGGTGGTGRYPTSSSVTGRGGKSSNVLRQPSSGTTKYKMNGIAQSAAKIPIDDGGLGGAGDAPPVGRLPITPPGTPQETSGDSDQRLSDACRHIQALNL